MIREIVKFARDYRLKNLQSMDGLEGIAWSASLYRAGSLIGTVRDNGDGGEMFILIQSKAERDRLTATAREVLAGQEFPTADIYLATLADYTQVVRRLTAKNRTHPVILHEDEKDDNGVPCSFASFKCKTTPENLAKLHELHPNKRFFADEIVEWTRTPPEAPAPGSLPDAPHREGHSFSSRP